MVMRRVFNHHVCLCVLSTAILAGLALMTSQTKVYAQAKEAKNCNGLAGGGEDKGEEPIVCDGGAGGTGDRKGVLSGERNIDMNGYPDYDAAVTVYNKMSGRTTTNIRIVAPLTVTDSKGSNNNPAIKVSDRGVLKLVGKVSVTEVKKGIVVDGLKSSVTVVEGKIGVRNGGGPVIEVKGGGTVELMRDVTVGTISGNKEVILIDGGGTVRLNGQSFSNVAMGMVVKGGGNANVKGGATITVKQDGTGFRMEGQTNASATVMELTINGGRNGAGTTGVEMKGQGGTLTLNNVKLMQLETGAKVTDGALRLNGDSKINVKGGGTGLEVSGSGTANVTSTAITVAAGATGVEVLSGTANVTNTAITLQGNGKGFKVEGAGKATVVSTTIKGDGKGMGVEMEESADVTLTNVTMSQVATGVEMKGTGGVLTVNGKSKIHVVGGGTGLNIAGSGTVTMNGTEIMAGGTGTGLKVGGRANVTLTSVTMSQVGTGVEVTGGKLTVNGTLTITGKGSETGMSVTDGTVMMKGGLTIKGSGTTGVQMSGGTVMLERVNISGVEAGVEMSGGERLTVEGGSIVGKGNSGVGINVTKGGTVTVERVEISGFTTGINMEAGESLTVKEGTTIDFGHSGTGVKVGKRVTMTSLTGVTITKSGGGGNRGVWVEGGEVKMERVGITGVQTGVDMGAEVKSAELMGVTIKGVERGIKMEGSGEFTVSETTIQFTGEDGYDYGIKVGESVKKAELTGVTIVGRGGGGNRGGWVKGGEVMMKDVNISNVQTGVDIEAGVTGATLTDVKISGVEKGVLMEKGESLTVDGGSIGFTGTYGIKLGSSVSKATLTGVEIGGDCGKQQG
ncbi:right-handed parallel beta-helix repeat-containing protein [Bartonella schoenbuchensis]|uniref:right-handed parallel beta-helix repeat-containing protein n=1 Tax=Bartonella schoenbuchensis TaxID=165694 RepID=UPI00314531A7